MSTKADIVATGGGPNLWANRLGRFLERYRSTSGVALHRVATRGPYDAVLFEWGGRIFQVRVREVGRSE